MASSAENPRGHLPAPFAATAAPPPTPSSQPHPAAQTSSSDFLSHLLHRLPPSLSPPSRRPSSLSSSSSSSSSVVTPPLLSLSDTPLSVLSASTELGFFHLAGAPMPADFPSAATSLFNLPDHRKKSLFPANWPLGHDDDDGAVAESFCLDSACSGELDLGSLREFAREMEKMGLAVVAELAGAAGFECPEPEKLCSLMWISDGSGKAGRVYPYVVGIHYQVSSQKQSLLSDSGWVNVSGRADSLLVTIGDIAQVWSNGKLKKVRGRPIPCLDHKDPNCKTVSLLITLSMDSTVSPLVPNLVEDEEEDEDDGDDHPTQENTTKSLFSSFSFEDYAWRVYHEPLLLKDPLFRYRRV